jgi:hypothetical protein
MRAYSSYWVGHVQMCRLPGQVLKGRFATHSLTIKLENRKVISASLCRNEQIIKPYTGVKEYGDV